MAEFIKMDPEYIESYLQIFNKLLLKEIKASQIILYMPSIFEHYCTILEIEKSSQLEANKEFLLYINKDCFTEFLEALKRSKFEKIYKILMLEEVKDDFKYKNIIKKYFNDFEKIEALPLIKDLYKRDVISLDDRKTLITMVNNKKPNQKIIRKLLFNLPFKKENWFVELIKALKTIKEISILEKINPDFIEDCGIENSMIIDENIPEVSNQSSLTDKSQYISCKTFLQETKFFPDILPELCNVDIKIFLQKYLEEDMINQPFYDKISKEYDQNNQKAYLELFSSVFQKKYWFEFFHQVLVKSKEEKILDILDKNEKLPIQESSKGSEHHVVSPDENISLNFNFREDDEHQNCTTINIKNCEDQLKRRISNKILIYDLPNNITKDDIIKHFDFLIDHMASDLDKSITILKNKTSEGPNVRVLIAFKEAAYAEQAIDIFNGTDYEGHIMKIKIAERVLKAGSIESNTIANENSILSSFDCFTTMTPILSNVDVLNLRNYQKELAQDAFKGENCIIVAPTGSGKTHVAMAIIKNHIDNTPSAKVIFLVPTVTLVDQQKTLFENNLTDLKILGVSGGEQDGQLPLAQFIPKHDIIVMTPQLMCNNLENDKSFSLSLLSLMIFDECHHTNKGHPYTKIMSVYIDIRLSGSQQKLPQIIGLTASVGVGKSKTNDQAKDYILKLCSNLDCPTISTVQQHIKELNEHVNKPDEKIEQLDGRQNDTFQLTIIDIMKKIEKRIFLSKEAKQACDVNSEIEQVMKPPPDRIGDPYTQWVSRIHALITAIYDQQIRRFFVSCLDYLKFFNVALLINADCRTIDAVNYCQTKINDLYNNPICQLENEIDQWLKSLWKESFEVIGSLATNKDNENPKLNYLKKLIYDFYKNTPDMRCILFCRTREMTKALVSWMLETEELKVLNPISLVGTNASSNKSGMTSVQQDDALKYFKEGKHKIIIATSVAEEGLDVQKCNLVIRYEHVTNSISRVQTRGRARAANAKFMLLSEKGRGAADKEIRNQIRERMMEQAITDIIKMRYEQKQYIITKYQKESQLERKMANAAKQISSINTKNTDDKFELRCLKCDQFVCNSDNIKKIMESHHVVLDPDYKERVYILPHPNPVVYALNFEKTGKTKCKKCNSDWGIQALYKKNLFYVIKCDSFIIVNLSNRKSQQYKKWKTVPFAVSSLNENDLQQIIDNYSTAIQQEFQDTSIDYNCFQLSSDEEDSYQ